MDVIEKLFKRRPAISGMSTFWIIFLLHKKPMNGYEIMKEIEASTTYKLTTGAVYPALYKLKKRGLIKSGKIGQRKQKTYYLTNSGKLAVEKMKEHMVERFRDFRFRRIIDSLLWAEEPDEIGKKFNELFSSVFNFRSSLKSKYKNRFEMKRAREKLSKIIKELKV